MRPKSGLCAFIDPTIRERVGQRLRQSSVCPPDLFDECLPSLDTFLRRQHALFGKYYKKQYFPNKIKTQTKLEFIRHFF